MNEYMSALADGELGRQDAARSLDSLAREAAARESWRAYHLIGDAMRGLPPLSPGFCARVMARIAGEGAARSRSRSAYSWFQWVAFPVAASLAAVALVGWLAFAPQRDTQGPPLAQAPQPAPQMEIAQVPPPDTANDYLLAHQGYSPRNSLQGMAPYVRMVSGEVAPAGR